MSRDPRDDLRRYRWHTGATLRRPEGPTGPLFRDVGPEATARFLRGELPRLAGPLSPITYLRTADYVEPYVDHGAIGRLVCLQPESLHPWHSGLPHVFVAPAHRWGAPHSVAYVPGDLALGEAAARLAGARTTDELAECLGGIRVYRARVAHALDHLDQLNAAHAATELGAQRLRRQLQGPRRDAALARMAQLDLDEADLCAAWHHLPAERRAHLTAVFS